MEKEKRKLKNNPTEKEELSLERIKTIRQRLGLSQVQAGELLGGGPRAFSKYESGLISPSASIATLLRLLEAAPENLITLTGSRATPINSKDIRPFEITGRHLAELTSFQLTSLLRRLLNAEANLNELPSPDIHVASSVTTSDEGEDGHIEWSNGPKQTRNLPARICQFQLKAGKITPKKASEDPINESSGEVESAVQRVLEKGGVYTMLSTRSYTGTAVSAREEAIREALTNAHVKISKNQVRFLDADQIALWVNQHPSVVVWVLEQTQPGLLGPFRSWTHWAGRREHDISIFVDDPRLTGLRSYVIDAVSSPGGIGRIVGYSGVGKSRLALESLGNPLDEEVAKNELSDLVLYVHEPETAIVKDAVQALADSELRAIIVIDHCDSSLHDSLAGIVGQSGSGLSLLTIDDEVPPDLSTKRWFFLEKAPAVVTEKMIENSAPGLPSEDKRRLVKFSKGYPKIASLLVDSWSKGGAVAYATDDSLIDRILLGRRSKDADLVSRTAMLLSVFGLVDVSSSGTPELHQIAPLSRNLTVADILAASEELISRGVLQRKGKSIIIQPRPIALRLAEKQWKQWSLEIWDHVLTNQDLLSLKTRAASQLSLLNTTEIAKDVVRHVCRYGGPLDSLEAISAGGITEVLSSLAEVDGATIMTLVKRILKGVNLAHVTGDTRRHLVWTLEKIAFDPNTFEEAAHFLFELSVNENESWSNNATGQFKSLFPVFLSDTAADGNARIRVFDDLLGSDEEPRLNVLVGALLEGIKLDYFSRAVGSETQGSRPALEPWRPKTWDEAWSYLDQCMERLVTLAKRGDSVGAAAREGLGFCLRSYASSGRIDLVEKVVREVCKTHGRYWPEALGSLGDLMQYDIRLLGEKDQARIKKLLQILQPEDVAERVKLIVTNMPWDYPCDEKLDYEERGIRQAKAVSDLVEELMKTPKLLQGFLPELCVGDQRMTLTFGQALGKKIKKPEKWIELIKAALLEAPVNNRNFNLLSGFLSSLKKRSPEIVQEFKKAATLSPDFAPALPLVCWQAGITPEDIDLVREAMRKGILSPAHIRQWELGGVLAKLPPSAVKPLFHDLFTQGDTAYSIGLDLLGMYVHTDKEKLQHLMPELQLLAASAGKWSNSHNQMDQYHFCELMKWVLGHGMKDPEARLFAKLLTKELVASVESNNGNLIRPLVPRLLSEFSEISWPILGKAIVSEKLLAWRFEHILGKEFTFEDQAGSPILSLPAETLFSWCHSHPSVAPAFVAVVSPILTSKDPKKNPTLHPVTQKLLDEFGEREEVLRGIHRNINSYSWTGSRANYYELYKESIRNLLTHKKRQVRDWAKNTLQELDADIASAHAEDEEYEAHYEI